MLNRFAIRSGLTLLVCAATVAAWPQALPAGLTRDLSRAAHVPPDGLDGFPLGCDPVVNVKDGSLLIRVPAGPFVLGSERWPEEGGEAFTVNLNHDYYIAVHEVTNAQYKRFVDATGHRAPDTYDADGSPEPVWKGNQFRSDQADHPVVGVSFEDMEAYCTWAGLRPPTELEWEKAARGTDGRTFPWGNEWDETRCRSAVAELTGAGPVYTGPVCEHPAGRSPWGLFGCTGNAAEWCVDWYEGAPDYERYKAGDVAPMLTGTEQRVIRGGGWQQAEFDWMLRTSQRDAAVPTERRCDLGFRVAMTP